MKRFFALTLILVSVLFHLMPAYTQDTDSSPTPGTRADNECYAGGTLEGKCGGNGFHPDGSYTSDEVEWAWKAGWYLARFNDGIIAREQIPHEFWSVLPGDTNSTSIESECFTLIQVENTLIVDCVIGNTVMDYEDNVDTGVIPYRPYHREGIIFWIELDSNIGDGGHCTYFASDLSTFTRMPLNRWIRNVWLNHGFKPTDDVCGIANFG